MRAQKRVAQGFPGIAFPQLGYGDDIAQGLRHLLPVEIHHAVVQPEVRQLLAAVGTTALRRFVFVVGEFQVGAAAVNINARPQMTFDHRRALDVPARASPPPGAVPARELGARRLPEHKVRRVALVGRDLYPSAGDHVLEGAAGEGAVGVVRGDRKEHVTFRCIGMA